MQSENQIRAKALDIKLFPVGQNYYLDGKREFLGDNPCTECVIVQSSGIRSKAAKIYRFREEALWKADDETYFNNPNEKYLIYENTKDYIGDKTTDEKDMALKAAFKIGFLLNRIVILPKLNCENNFNCTILHRYRIEALDDFFKLYYREHVFLQNKLVPKEIKSNICPKIYLIPENANNTNKGKNSELFESSSLRYGIINSFQIVNWFKNELWSKYGVLQFDSLYFDVRFIGNDVSERINEGLCKSDYMQKKTMSSELIKYYYFPFIQSLINI